MIELTVCPSTLQEGFSTYCNAARKCYSTMTLTWKTSRLLTVAMENIICHRHTISSIPAFICANHASLPLIKAYSKKECICRTPEPSVIGILRNSVAVSGCRNAWWNGNSNSLPQNIHRQRSWLTVLSYRSLWNVVTGSRTTIAALHFLSNSLWKLKVSLQTSLAFYAENGGLKAILNFDIGYHIVIVESPMATAGARSQALTRGCQHKNEVRANSKYFPF